MKYKTENIRISVMSDLHLEFNPPGLSSPSLAPLNGKVDIVLLAGDIDDREHVSDYPKRLADELNVPIIWIAGNHEYYGGSIEEETQAFHESCEFDPLVHFLQDCCWQGDVRGYKVRVLGSTLWTDYDLYGTPKASMQAAAQMVQDHRMIAKGKSVDRALDRRFAPRDAIQQHKQSRAWLESELKTPFDGVTVVMSHHAPHRMSIDAKYSDNDLTPAFVSDLGHVIAQNDIDVWVHGHTHSSMHVYPLEALIHHILLIAL